VLCAIGPVSSGGTFDVERKRQRLTELEGTTSDPSLWQGDRTRVEALMREKRGLERDVQFFAGLETALSDAEVLVELAESEDDADTAQEAVQQVARLRGDLEAAELRRLLSGEHDAKPAIVTLTSGEGGTDSCDWTEMLLRMYLRWCERRGLRCEILDVQPGDEAGIKGATFSVEGDHPYGYLKTEIGIHRLVRISPFDAQARRQTSFASFAMIPDIEGEIEIDIDDKDLRIDTYRAGGAGGQHVNRTDSAVRITHLPTGLVVQCQNERSQHKNKASAMKVLKARLYERAEQEQKANVEKLAGEKKNIGFGSQIRSYTLHPSQRVKDHRTDFEMGNATAVLDGDLDGFIRARLLQMAESG
jgi:peptide chain release factor 2